MRIADSRSAPTAISTNDIIFQGSTFQLSDSWGSTGWKHACIWAVIGHCTKFWCKVANRDSGTCYDMGAIEGSKDKKILDLVESCRFVI